MDKNKNKKHFEWNSSPAKATSLDDIPGTLESAVVFWARGPCSQVPLWGSTCWRPLQGWELILTLDLAAKLSVQLCFFRAIVFNYFKTKQNIKALLLIKHLLLCIVRAAAWGLASIRASQIHFSVFVVSCNQGFPYRFPEVELLEARETDVQWMATPVPGLWATCQAFCSGPDSHALPCGNKQKLIPGALLRHEAS